MTATADIVIIGGGVQGAGLAYHLARAKAGKIVLLEKRQVASGPTARSSAMIRPLFMDEVYVRLVQEATELFEHWDGEVGGDPGFVQNGFLRITDTLDADALGGDLGLMKGLGVEFEILKADALPRHAATGEFREDEMGVLFPRGGSADPIATTRSLAAAAARDGVEVMEGVGVTGIELKNGRIRSIRTDHGEIDTRVAVNCGGAWGHRIAALAGLRLPIEIHRTPVCLFRRPENMGANGPILSDGVNEIVLLKADDKHLRAGLFAWSTDPADPDAYDETISQDQLSGFREALQPRYSGMRTAPFLGGFSALYDMTPDAHPIVGESEVEGFWNNCGWSGNGFAGAPAFGRCLAAEITGSVSEIDISPFRWPRPPGVKERHL